MTYRGSWNSCSLKEMTLLDSFKIFLEILNDFFFVFMILFSDYFDGGDYFTRRPVASPSLRFHFSSLCSLPPPSGKPVFWRIAIPFPFYFSVSCLNSVISEFLRGWYFSFSSSQVHSLETMSFHTSFMEEKSIFPLETVWIPKFAMRKE